MSVLSARAAGLVGCLVRKWTAWPVLFSTKAASLIELSPQSSICLRPKYSGVNAAGRGAAPLFLTKAPEKNSRSHPGAALVLNAHDVHGVRNALASRYADNRTMRESASPIIARRPHKRELDDITCRLAGVRARPSVYCPVEPASGPPMRILASEMYSSLIRADDGLADAIGGHEGAFGMLKAQADLRDRRNKIAKLFPDEDEIAHGQIVTYARRKYVKHCEFFAAGLSNASGAAVTDSAPDCGLSALCWGIFDRAAFATPSTRDSIILFPVRNNSRRPKPA
jgi:hypothetical protein